MLNVKSLATGAVVLGLTLGAAVSIAAAQQSDSQTGQPESATMAHRGAGMMGMVGADTAQMNRMIENCNRLMESMMQSTSTAPRPENKG